MITFNRLPVSTRLKLLLSLAGCVLVAGACQILSAPTPTLSPTARPALSRTASATQTRPAATVTPTTLPASATASALPPRPSTVPQPSPYPPPVSTPVPYPPPTPVTPSPYPTVIPTVTPPPVPTVVTPGTIYMPIISNYIPTPTPIPPTPRPEPTDTPRPPWPEPLAGQTASKLGLHVLAVYVDPDILEFVRRVHPRVINAPDDQAGLANIKAVSPGTVTLSRVNVNGQDNWVTSGVDAAAAAEHYVAVNLDTYKKNPAVDYWEGINEFNPQTPEAWDWFTQFEATRVCAMQAQGLHAAVGEFSVGWPNTYDQMVTFLPALEAAKRCGGIFTVHEYNGPTFSQGVDVNAPNIIPGAPALSVSAGYFTLRYRFWYEGLLKPRGLGDLPLVITELAALSQGTRYGCDQANGICAWKQYQDWWVKQGYGATGPEAYVNLLAWYDAQMRQDPYVLGATIFTTGEFAGHAWASFDLHHALIPLAQYEAQLQP